MTIRERMIEKLHERGVQDGVASAVMARVEASPATKSMAGRWDEDEDSYPIQMIAVCLLLVTEEAKKEA